MNSLPSQSVQQTMPCVVHVRKVHLPGLDPERLNILVASLDRPIILGGHGCTGPNHRFSYWAAEPRETVSFTPPDSNPWHLLNNALNRYKLRNPLPPGYPARLWTGGWAGYFGYELGRYIEHLPAGAANDLQLPWLELGFYDRLLAYDHQSGDFWYLALACGDETETQAIGKLDLLEEWAKAAERLSKPVLCQGPHADVDVTELSSNMSRDQYLKAIQRILNYIREGETYQINLSQRFTIPYVNDPVYLFLWQNRFNPAPYAAFLAGPDYRYVCASPELFIDLNNGFIRTKPIKGTRARLSPNLTDATLLNKQNYRDLVESLKEQAELNMIVDLERNDLARICVPGTRRVLQGRTIETYATVYHAVATIGGQLRPGLELSDILQAIFPGGSITGAPKIRSMEIIDELEPTMRGVYTGSIGWVGLNGNACLNIAIRTIIITRQRAYAQAGGGIVADSEPAAEFQETIVKAQALLKGIMACNRQG